MKINDNKLTNREKEVLYLIIEGKSNPEIAKVLSISKHTVKAHIENLYRKLEVHNKVQITIKAIILKEIDIEKLKIFLKK